MIAIAFWLVAVVPVLLWVGAALYVVVGWLGLWEYRDSIVLLYGCGAALYSVRCGLSKLHHGSAA